MKLLSIPKEAAACRAAFAAQPGATAALHVHHEILAERLIEPIERRIAYILAAKPEAERALRLRLMRPLPPADAAYAAVSDAAYAVAVVAAVVARDAAAAATYAVGIAAARDARDAYDAAIAALAVIVDTWAQHDTRCVPDCPWDGKTIFPETKPL